MHYYRTDAIAEVWQGKRSLRSLRVMVQGLPPESATGRAVRGSYWLDSEYILADISDTLRVLLHGYQQVHSKENSTIPEPTFTRRPGYDPVQEKRDRADRMQAVRGNVLRQVLPRG